MNKKNILTAVLVFLIVVLAALCGLFVYHYYLQRVPPVVGAVVSVAPGSVTLTVEDGSQKTYAVPTSLKVISEVAGDETGKYLTELAVGTPLRINFAKNFSRTVTLVRIFTGPPPPARSPLGPPTSITGTVISKTGSSLVLQSVSSHVVHIVLASTTAYYSIVSSGQKGKTAEDMVPGDMINVDGVADNVGVTAQLIQFFNLNN